MTIRSPERALLIMNDIATLTRGYVRTLSNGTHDTFIKVTSINGDIALWSHDIDDCEIVVIRDNPNVKQYLLNLEKRRQLRRML